MRFATRANQPRPLWLWMVLVLAVWPAAADAQNSPFLRDRHVEAALVGEKVHLEPGVPYRVGLLLRHDPGWHTYWKSTATGYATSVAWRLPDGFTVSELQWPVPKVYAFQGLVDYVYEGEVLLMATLVPPADWFEPELEIGFTAEWLMCAEVCMPGRVSSSLTVPVRHGAAQPSAWADRFARADFALPAPPVAYSARAMGEARTVILEIRGTLPDSVYFFDDKGVFQPEPAARVQRPAPDTLRVELKLDPATAALPQRLTGTLAGFPGWPQADLRPGLAIDLPILAAPAASLPPDGASLGLLLLAFLGGLILNLMPCVFPVLGIKIMGFVAQAGESRGRVIAHGLIFTGGVLASFWALAGVLLALRAGGEQLGWGFQLQSPGFVLALTLLLFAFGLNLSGLFEVGQSAVGVGAGLVRRSGLGGSFFSGVLATVVATPCAAPFLAPALGAALALPPLASFLLFTCIALGLATPYLVLSGFPALIALLPKPGAWMETFKQAMAFLLYATVAYLLWVLAGQLTEGGGYTAFALLKVLASLVLLALGLWVYGRWTAYHRPRRVRTAGAAVSVAIIAAAIAAGFSGTRPESWAEQGPTWEDWAPGKAEALAAAGRVVYVDFTARWCVTCQTNKAAVFSSARVRGRLRELDAVLLRADWTHQDPAITQALAAFGRSAVPFNLVYGPGTPEPIVLPELLTPAIVLDALERAAP